MSNKFKSKSSKMLLIVLAGAFILTSVSGAILSVSKYNIFKIDGKRINIQEFVVRLTRDRERVARSMKIGDEGIMNYINSESFTIASMNTFLNDKLLEKEILKYNLDYNDNLVSDKITQEQSFVEDNGKFSLVRFETFLQNSNRTEQQFINELKNNLSKDYIAGLFLKNYQMNKNILNNLVKVNNLYKNVKLYTINIKDIKTNVKTPTKEEKLEYYKTHITDFTIEKMVKVNYIKISAIKNNKPITDVELKKLYDENIDDYKLEGGKDVYIIESTNKEAIEKIKKEFDNNKNILELAKKHLNLNEKDVLNENLSDNSLKFLFEEDLANLNQMQLSNIIKADSRYSLVYIKKINRAKTIGFNEMKVKLIEQLKQERGVKKVDYDLIAKLEEELLIAESLKDIAKSKNLKEETFGFLNKKNLKNQKNMPNLEFIFDYDKNDFSELISYNNEYFVFSIADVKELDIKDFELVEKEIENILINDEKEQKYNTELNKFLDKNKINDKELLKRRFTIKNIDVKQNSLGYKKDFLTNLFTKNEGETTYTYRDGDNLYFAKVLKNKYLNKNQDGFLDSEAIETSFINEINNEISLKYMEYLKEKYNVKIYYDLLKLLR